MNAKYLFVILLLLAGCSPEGTGISGRSANRLSRSRPSISRRRATKKLIGDEDEGSCVFASMVSLLRWQGRYQAADRIRDNYGNGAGPTAR